MLEQTTLAQKIALSRVAIFVDFDGTVFTLDKNLVVAPFYNTYLKYLLERKKIPLIIVTGRADWATKAEAQAILLGLPKADAVIAGAGTTIYYRLPNGHLGKDASWEKKIQQSTVQWEDGKKVTWNQEILLQKISSMLPKEISIFPKTIDPYLIRLRAKEIPISKLNQWKKAIELYFFDTIQVIFAEKLLQKNSTTIFSGHILIAPKGAGKEKAVSYMLTTLSDLLTRTTKTTIPVIQAFCFGDATVDTPMLLLKPQLPKFTIKTYGVNLTPFAKKNLQDSINTNPQVHIIETPPSPKAIVDVVKNIVTSLETNRYEKATITKLSPAQNNWTRRLLHPFELFLDTFYNKNLTANAISLQGLAMVKKSMTILYGEKPATFFEKCNAWQLYITGIFADIFDGIRARNTSPKNTSEIPGQLVDVFCDRAKEFCQLYQRGRIRLDRQQKKLHKETSYQTFLAAISCILPSIARAEAEIYGIVVKEKDSKGGSMSTRTKNLCLSILLDTLGFSKFSYVLDKKIYVNNIATFQNRKQAISIAEKETRLQKQVCWENHQNKTHLQQQAGERFLLLIQVLQEENSIIEKALQKHPIFLKKYTKDWIKIIQAYLIIDVETLQKQNKIKNFRVDITKQMLS